MKFPYYKQETNYTCGACAIRMALEGFGIKKSEKQISKLLGTNKIRGTWPRELPKLAEKFKLNYFVGRNSKIEDLEYYLKNNFIIIVAYWYPLEKVDHYSVVKKIDEKFIYFWDPWFGEEHKYTLTYFKKIWKSDKKFDNEKSWFIAIKK
jgi:ABC-type bacteriocin/lantibiotic exporter with double-glycine peptidase domain